MNNLLYLLQVNLYLLLFYGFYVLLLKKETFFKLNRIYLVGSVFLAFIIPVIQSGWIRSLFVTQQVKQATEALTLVITASTPVTETAADVPSMGWGGLLALIYFAGLVFFLGRLVWQLFALYKHGKNNTATNQAYSFFGKIVVSEHLAEREIIYSHEQVHSAQLHSADVIFFELVAAINWFNPVVYAYKNTIRHIHEFIADEVASTRQRSKSDYALLLVSNAFGIAPGQLANNFHNQSLLKQRIAMLHQSKSKKAMLLKYGLSAPLFAGMLVFSSSTMPVQASVERIANDIKESAGHSTELFSMGSVPSRKRNQPVVVSSGKISSADLPSDKSAINPVIEEPSILSEDTVKAVKKDESKSAVIKEDNMTYEFAAIEHAPAYPGGENAFRIDFQKNFKWSAEALQRGASGRITLQFTVEKDGSLSDFKVLKDLGMGTGAEAVRVLKAMMPWKPGVQNGKPVRVAYVLPVLMSVGAK